MVDETPSVAEYSVDLPLFHGPLDLLLHLIRTEEMDIHDIPISRLVEQYRAALSTLDFSLTSAGEYLYMLSVLMVIKTHMLLPRAPAPEEDPREPLVQQLLAYEEIKKVADDLARRSTLFGSRIGRESHESYLSLEDVTLYDISNAFANLLVRLEKENADNFIPSARPSVKDVMVKLLDQLPLNGKTRALPRIFETVSSRMEAITLFIAILELTRLGAIGLIQEEGGGEIFLKRKKRKVNVDILEVYA